jgi:hypothetical protein
MLRDTIARKQAAVQQEEAHGQKISREARFGGIGNGCGPPAHGISPRQAGAQGNGRASPGLSDGKKLEAATNGRISVQMYPSMQLGGEKEMIEQAQVGALQIARISVGPMGPIVPELNVFNLPFMFRDNAHGKGDRRRNRR